MRSIVAVILLLVLQAPAAASESCVALLHGLGRTASAMKTLETYLLDHGYKVWNRSYPSTKQDVTQLATTAIQPAVEYCGGVEKTNFVTHSLGGILVRAYLQGQDYRGRIVMLSPPNKGSEIPDVMEEVALFEKLLGPAATQLGTGESSVPNSLGEIAGEVGVIAGNRTLEPWFSWLIPGADDGKVSVASTRLPEMKDFLLVNHGHTFIMRSDQVIEQIRHFLETGAFNHTED